MFLSHTGHTDLVLHTNTHRETRFLALDKCLPNRDFLQVVSIPRPAHERRKGVRFEHDVEWLAIVKRTHELLSRSEREAPLPTEVRLVTEEDKAWCVRAWVHVGGWPGKVCCCVRA